MIYIAMLIGGLGLAAWNTRQRLGRTRQARSWARGMPKEFAERNVLVLWPLLAVSLLLGAALGAAAGSTAASVAVGLPFAAAMLLWLAYAVLPLPVPWFVQPRWYRELRPPSRRPEARRG